MVGQGEGYARPTDSIVELLGGAFEKTVKATFTIDKSYLTELWQSPRLGYAWPRQNVVNSQGRGRGRQELPP